MKHLSTPIKALAVRAAQHPNLSDFEKLERLSELYHKDIIDEDEFEALCSEAKL